MAGLLAVLTVPARADETLGTNLITNGCFTDPYCVNGAFQFCNPIGPNAWLNAPTNTGWFVTSGNVEPLVGTFWAPTTTGPAPSNCLCTGSIDMNGAGSQPQATVIQAVPIVDGNNYAIYLDVRAALGGV